MSTSMKVSSAPRLTVALALATAAAPGQLFAQWSTLHEQTSWPASHNWAFRQNFGFADRLFNAFDYGHAILYETLYTRPGADPRVLEEDVYRKLTEDVLVRPPHVPLEEAAVMVQYAKLVPEAKAMFDWAHALHRQAYDVWADERVPLDEKDARMAEIFAYYLSRPEITFSTRPKSMDLMDGQSYSLAFREGYPRFNGLIWAYHWLQVGLYEPLIAGRTPGERQALAQSTVARFWQMIAEPPESMPYLMPMTAAVAPLFSARYPEIAIVFDNLHMMHDVVSDILASSEVPREAKRAEILRAIELFSDDTTGVTSVEEWRQMALGMGLHNQGGPAIGFMPEPAPPTVPRGMSMAGMTGGGMDHSAHMGAPGSGGVAPTGGAAAPAGGDPPPEPGPEHAMNEEMAQVMSAILRILEDARVANVIHSDPALHELWSDPAVQRHLESMRTHHGATPAAGGVDHTTH